MQLHFFTILLLTSSAVSKVVIPAPNGTYGVSLVDLQLVDESRRDPYSHAPHRIVPVSIITPIGAKRQCDSTTQPYMPNTTASYWERTLPSLYSLPISLNDTFTQIELSLCKPQSAYDEAYPLIFFSPGLGISQQFYHIMCTNLAAQGYTVVSVEVPGQADIVTYDDGSVQYGNSSIVTEQQLVEANDVRVADINFVLEYLSSPSSAQNHHPSFHHSNSHAGIFGHSLGGAAALSTILNNSRFIGGADFDGGFVGAPLTHATTKPFLLWASSIHNQSNVPSWPTVWHNLKGWKLQLQSDKSAHGTFTDLPFLVQRFGIDPGASNLLAPFLGTINAEEALMVIVEMMQSLFEFVFYDGKNGGKSVVDEARRLGDIAIVNATNGRQS
jgi:dienelactone hydrolase